MRNFFASLWGAISTYLKSDAFVDLLEAKFKALFIKFLKLQSLGGLRGWLLKLAAEHAAEEVLEHIINPAIRKLNYEIEVYEGNRIIKKMGNAADYDEWRRNAHKL